MKQPLIFVALLACTLCGCGKKDSSSAQSKSQPTPEQAAQIESEYILPERKVASAAPPTVARPSLGQPRPNLAQSVQPIQERINGAIHAQLTMQLRMYVQKNGRMPQTFSEFAYSSMDSVPPVPEGMKFVIDPVDKAVKVVKK